MNFDQLKLLLLDVDGVLTDGSIFIDDDGRQTKRFNVKDGQGLAAWRKLGIKTGILTARVSRAVTHRADELKIDYLTQGASNKLIGFENLMAELQMNPDEVAYIGDDLTDLPVLTRVGYPIAPADAVAEVRDIAHYVTAARGGEGAVREAVEHLLRKMNRWDEVLDLYAI